MAAKHIAYKLSFASLIGLSLILLSTRTNADDSNPWGDPQPTQEPSPEPTSVLGGPSEPAGCPKPPYHFRTMEQAIKCGAKPEIEALKKELKREKDSSDHDAPSLKAKQIMEKSDLLTGGSLNKSDDGSGGFEQLLFTPVSPHVMDFLSGIGEQLVPTYMYVPFLTNNGCHDRRLIFDHLCHDESGYFHVKLLPPSVKLGVHIEMLPSTKYRYPVDKIEAPQVAFRTRYVTKSFVKSMKDIILDESATFVQVRIEDRVNQALGAANMPNNLKISEDDINKVKDSTDRSLRPSSLPGQGYRSAEYHAMPEVASRDQYNVFNQNDYKLLPVPSVALDIHAPANPTKDAFQIYIPIGPIVISVGASVEPKIEGVKPLCHDNLTPTKLEEWDEKKHFFGSEFPPVGFDGANNNDRFGGFDISRNEFAIFEDDYLSPFAPAYQKLLGDPLMCEKYSKREGLTPQDLMLDEIQVPAGAHLDRRKYLPCLKNSNDSWLPFLNVARTPYDTVASVSSFMKGKQLSQIFKNGASSPHAYQFDYETDRVQWLGPDPHMPKGCTELDGRSFLDYGANQQHDQGLGKAANMEFPADSPNVGVHWREFWCCPKGHSTGFGIAGKIVGPILNHFPWAKGILNGWKQIKR